MRPVAVEVVHVLAEDAPRMGLAQDQEVVQAFPPDAPEEAFAGGVLPGGAIGRPQLRDAGGGGERAPVDARPYLAIVDGAGRVTEEAYGDPQATPRFTAWAPDGRRLASVYTQNTAGMLASVGLLTPAPLGEAPTAARTLAGGLDGATAEQAGVRWAPDGQALAFLRAGQIVVARGPDLAETRILAGAARGWPAWQPGTAP